jgi:flagellin FlaB
MYPVISGPELCDEIHNSDVHKTGIYIYSRESIYTYTLGQPVLHLPSITRGLLMNSIKQRDEGFTGLEAAIVLIAFVVVAAVFSYVVLGAGFFTTQKSQETVYKGVEQSTSNLQMVGNVYGTTANTAVGVKNISFNIGLAPGAPALDISKMIVVVTRPGSQTVSQLVYTATDPVAGTSFSAVDASIGVTAPTLQGQNQTIITVHVTDDYMPKNGIVYILLSPAVGASLPFTRTAPATIQNSQILY